MDRPFIDGSNKCTPLERFGDPDLTGWGVISAFIISFLMTYVSIVLAYFLRALPPERYTRIDDVIIKSVHSLFCRILCLNYKDKENSNPEGAGDHLISMEALNIASESPTPSLRSVPRARTPSDEQLIHPSALPQTPSLPPTCASSIHNPDGSPPEPFQARQGTWFAKAKSNRIESFEAFLLTMSDQQLVTGFAIVLVTAIMRKISQVPFHVQIIAIYLGYFSCIIHLCTLTTIRNYFDRHRRLLHLRALLMITLLILLLHNIWGVLHHKYYFKSNAECIIVDRLDGALSSIVLTLILITGYLQRFVEIYTRSRQSATTSWILLLAFKIGPKLEEAYVRDKHYREIIEEVPKEKFDRLTLAVITAMKGLYTSLFLDIIQFSGYFTLGMAYIIAAISSTPAIIQAPPSFGQFVPLFLLALPIMNAFGISSRAHAQGDTHADSIDALPNIDTQTHSTELPAPANSEGARHTTARLNAICYLFEKFGLEAKIYLAILIFILFGLLVFWGVCFSGAVRNFELTRIAYVTGFMVEVVRLGIPVCWSWGLCMDYVSPRIEARIAARRRR